MDFLKINSRITYPGFTGQYQLTIPKGFTGIIGPSGHGKSTLLHLIAGFIKPDHGIINSNGETWTSTDEHKFLPPEKRNIGYVFQSGRLFPHLNVKQNLLFGVSKGKKPPEFDELVNALQIEHLLAKQIDECSGGEQQRIAIGRSLLPKPKNLIMDEPFASIDKGLRNIVVRYVRLFCERFDINVLLTSHDIIDTLLITDRLILIYKGAVIAQGNVFELLRNNTGLKMLEEVGLHNIVKMQINKVDPTEGMVFLTHPNCESLSVIQEPMPRSSKTGKELHVSIKPDVISLSLQPLSDISIQNQLHGTIKDIVKKENRCYCLVDCGIELLCEITIRSLNELDIKIGKPVYCLFKALSVKTIA